MRRFVLMMSMGAVTSLCCATNAGAGTLTCPADSVKVGTACIDRYEASVWQIPPTNKALVKKVQDGKATLADLTSGGATLLSPSSLCDPPYPDNFPVTGNWTPTSGSNPPSPGVYAVSIPGVLPSACITWFQANQACRLSGKRLARNDEWQAAAQGTPDPGTDNGTSDCNISSTGDAVNTGSRSNCKSSWGAFDMVGNVSEWVADWGDLADGCTNWPADFGSDQSCFAGPGAGLLNLPGPVFRGGDFNLGTDAGVFFVSSFFFPTDSDFFLGFRCAR